MTNTYPPSSVCRLPSFCLCLNPCYYCAAPRYESPAPISGTLPGVGVAVSTPEISAQPLTRAHAKPGPRLSIDVRVSVRYLSHEKERYFVCTSSLRS